MKSYQNLLWQIESECEKWELGKIKHHFKKTILPFYKTDKKSLDHTSKILTGFWIKENVGNNSFVFKEGNKLYVPPLKKAKDLKPQTASNHKIVFRDKDENGNLIEATGLKSFIFSRGERTGIPYYVVDNHNWVFFCWAEQAVKKNLRSLLVHIDAHKDEVPATLRSDLNLINLDSVKRQTIELKVSNYISAAIQAELIQPKFLSLTSSKDLEDYTKDFELIKRDSQNIILNVDLDIFSPEVSCISLAKKVESIGYFLNQANLATFATSPGFIDQNLAIEIVKIITKYL